MDEDDRYKPPASRIADPVPLRMPAPVTVRNACWLILLAMALSYMTLLPGVGVDRGPLDRAQWIGEAVWNLFFAGLTIWLTVKIRQRRNWARWLLGWLTVFGWMLLAAAWSDFVAPSPLTALLLLAASALEAWAGWLLFTGPGRRWFQAGRR